MNRNTTFEPNHLINCIDVFGTQPLFECEWIGVCAVVR